ncbi:MAG: tetratricopeptide repeat protein, partial [Bacteroidales bacterium]
GAMAALRLFNSDGEYRMTRFLAEHPGTSRANEALTALGDYFYQNKNYRKAVIYYRQVNRILLSTEKMPEYCFRYGYSQYMNGDRSTALLMFSEIKDIDTYYTAPALYYFSHIAYEEKKYETALEGFMRLRNDETFGSVVPFYIVQIMYLRKDYDGILEIAPELLKSASKMRAVELYRFIGDAYYNKGNYKEATDYLEKYGAGAKASGREDKFQLAYCYYMTGEYDKAVKVFLELTARSDILSQNVWFLLGDCYLKKNDKNRAQFAFGQASLLNYDARIKEESLFNYAKLLYETSYSPFGEAIRAFQEYINLYPGSDRIQEVYNYLVSTYMQIKNYREALASLDKITRKDTHLEEAYQRVAFYRGLELFKNMELQAAINMFDKSLEYEKYNRQLRARAIYWRGEAWYRLGQYVNAISDYQVFMGIPGSMQLDEYNLVRYNLGYAFFNQKDYFTALTHFKTFEAAATAVRPDILVDARNRIADCYFINTNYAEAVEFYNKVIEFGKIDTDYALYQKGFALGLMNNQKAKAETLTALISGYTSSKYVPGALYERGRAWVSLKDRTRGEADFNQVVTSFPGSPFAPRAIVQLGLLYFDTGENEKAITQFKKVIENYSSTPEARYAFTGLKNAYVEINDVESYFAYVKSLKGFGDFDLAEKDSLLYISGEKLYMAGNCDKASEIFRNYLNEFPYASFRINALFYLSECAMTKGRKDEALNNYLQVIESPGSDFYEVALQSVAALMFENEDYLKAFGYYEQLEKVTEKPEIQIMALRGQLKSAWEAGDAEKTIIVAEKISKTQSAPEELLREATFMAAKAHHSLNHYDEALREFRKTATEITTVQGAESKYRVAELLNLRGNNTEAEKVINEFISLNTPHQYWMAKIFILLADINTRKGDIILARATLQGLRDNYSAQDDGIIDEVKSRLDSLNARQTP